MNFWTPINKATGVQYPPVSDAGKAAMESDPMTKGKYTFKVAADAVPKTPKLKAEKEKLVPVGVDITEELKEEKNTGEAAL